MTRKKGALVGGVGPAICGTPLPKCREEQEEPVIIERGKGSV